MKKIKFTVLFLILLLSDLVIAQNRSDAALKADSLHKQAKIHFKQQDSTHLFQNLSEALSMYQSLQDTNSMANVTNDFGYYYYFYGDFEKSIPYYRQALALDAAQGDTIGMIGRHYNLAGAYENLGRYVPALEHRLQGLDLAKTIGRAKSMAMSSNGLAGLYREQEQYEQALHFYHQALWAYNSIPDSLGASYVLNNLGMLHKGMQNYDSAGYYYQQAMRYKLAVANERSQANTMTNLGELYMLKDSLQQALPYLLKAQRIFQQKQDTYRMAWAGNKLAELYLRQGSLAPARLVLDSVESYLQQELNARAERLNYLENEYRWHEAQGKSKAALDYHKQWAALRDSLFNEDKLQVQQMQSAYQIKQEEQAKKLAQQDARLAQADARRQAAITIAVSLILGIIVGLGLLLYYQYIKIRRLSRKNELLVKEQHHRVKNNLQVLGSMLRMQARRTEEKLAKDAMTESELRVQAMSLIHRRLYGASLTKIPMKSYIEELITEIKNCYGCTAHLDMQIEDITLDDRQAVPIGLIINEVVSNACKYAFPDHPNPELKVRLERKGLNSYRLSLQDNGPGLDREEVKKKRTFGMELIMLQAEQIYAKAKFTNQQGNLFTLSFSKSYQDE